MSASDNIFTTGGDWLAIDATGFQEESDNAILTSNQALNVADKFQTSKANAIYASKGDFYQEGGGSAANSYVLENSDALQEIFELKDGMRIRFRVINTNTGASSVNVNSLGAKAIEYAAAALLANMILVGNIVTLIYKQSTDKFELEYTLTDNNLSVYPAGTGVRIDQGNLTIGQNATVGTLDKFVTLNNSVNNSEIGYNLTINDGVNGRRVNFFLDDNDGTFGASSEATSGVADFVVKFPTEKMRLTSTGNLLVGNTTEGAKLHVGDGTSTTLGLFFKDDDAGDTTDTISLLVGNKNSGQGKLRFSYTNEIAFGSPESKITFEPRNSADSGAFTAAEIKFDKTPGLDEGSILLRILGNNTLDMNKDRTINNNQFISNLSSSNAISNAISVHALSSSYTGTVLDVKCTRTSSASFTLIEASANAGADAKFVVTGEGYVKADGTFNGGGADSAEYFESVSGGNIPAGTTVVLEQGKVRPALAGEEPLGVIRNEGTSTFVGNNQWNEWKNKWLKDDFGKKIEEEVEYASWEEDIFEDEEVEVTEEVENTEFKVVMKNGKWTKKKIKNKRQVPIIARHDLFDEDGNFIGVHEVPETQIKSVFKEKKQRSVKVSEAQEKGITIPRNSKRKTQKENRINPEYDPEKDYIPYEEREEMVIVGLNGQVQIRKGEPISLNWIKMSDVNKTVELYFIK